MVVRGALALSFLGTVAAAWALPFDSQIPAANLPIRKLRGQIP